MTADLTTLSATAMAGAVGRGELDALELIESHLRRIAEVEPAVRAFESVLATEARRDAEELRARRDLSTLPLAGVPVAIKDNVDVAGEPTTHGSRATSRATAGADDLLVRRLRTAGAVVIGRTRMPELAIWPFTEWIDAAPVRNPWDTTRTPGGSSGGSAAAVAARMAALALASDGGGSIRIPAACCGLVGIKPAPGVVPVPGGRPHWHGLSAFGPLARSVEDAALMLDVLSGSTQFRDADAPDAPLRVAFTTKHPMAGARTSPAVRDAVEDVASMLRRAGHRVGRHDPPYPMVPVEFVSRFLAGIAEDAAGVDAQRLEPRTRAMARAGRVWRRPAPAHRSRYARRMARWFSDVDVLLAPITAGPAKPIGNWQGRGWIATMLGVSRWMGFAPPWNLAGLAAVAVPAGSDGGLPIGVQLVAPSGSEGRLIGLALQIQAARPFALAPL